MKLIFLVVIAGLVLFFGCQKRNTPSDTMKEGPVNEMDLSGTWEGNLNAGKVSLRMVFNLSRTDGTYTGTIDSPDQDAFGIQISAIKATRDTVELRSDAIGGVFRGTFKDNMLKGSWKQGLSKFPLELKKLDGKKDYSRPQDPQGPFPYTIEDVSFMNQTAGIRLSGTLTYARENVSGFAVVLLSGSGPQNRNEEIMNHRPFLVLADFLTRNGITVLRFDDRGVGESEGDFSSATGEDFISDGEAAFNYLKGRSDLSLSSVGIIGHSEGAMLAPMIAARNSDVGFIVLLAGPGGTGEDLLLEQTRAILKVQGHDDAYVKKIHDANKKSYDILLQDLSEKQIRTQLEDWFRKQGIPSEQIPDQINSVMTPWFKHFLTSTARPSLETLRIPVFALNGSLDVQVPAAENLTAIENVLRKAGNTHYTIRTYEGLNHLFQTAGTGLMNEYAQIEETISPLVLEDISDWILAIKK